MAAWKARLRATARIVKRTRTSTDTTSAKFQPQREFVRSAQRRLYPADAKSRFSGRVGDAGDELGDEGTS